jgi:hypothetical protein
MHHGLLHPIASDGALASFAPSVDGAGSLFVMHHGLSLRLQRARFFTARLVMHQGLRARLQRGSRFSTARLVTHQGPGHIPILSAGALPSFASWDDGTGALLVMHHGLLQPIFSTGARLVMHHGLVQPMDSAGALASLRGRDSATAAKARRERSFMLEMLGRNLTKRLAVCVCERILEVACSLEWSVVATNLWPLYASPSCSSCVGPMWWTLVDDRR